MSNENVEIKENFFIMVIKGTSVGIIFTLLTTLVFAFIINICSLPSSVIKPVNQFVKIMAIFIGCFFSLKGSLGFLKGAIIGLLTFTITYLIFACVYGSFSFSTRLYLDLLFSVIVGLVSGIICVNLKKK